MPGRPVRSGWSRPALEEREPFGRVATPGRWEAAWRQGDHPRIARARSRGLTKRGVCAGQRASPEVSIPGGIECAVELESEREPAAASAEEERPRVDPAGGKAQRKGKKDAKPTPRASLSLFFLWQPRDAERLQT